MTKREYRQYEARVKAFFETEGITNLTASPPSEHCLCEESEPQEYSEAYFSSQPCECCGSSLAGDRQHATGFNSEHKTVLCYEVCQDCLYYVAYGEFDDQTMMDIAEPSYERFDIVAAHYLWLSEHHGGQSSPEYERLCKITTYYKPSLFSVSDNARAIYDQLCEKHNCDHD